jgi:HK97 family phage prohead protease
MAIELKKFTKQLIFKATGTDDENYVIRGVFSTSDADRQGEIIDQNGWKLDEYMQNPVVLFAHDHWQPAIGKMIELGKDAVGNLVGAIQFAVKEYDFAKTIYNLYKGKYMRAFSVGFETPMDKVEEVEGVIILREANLYEVSAVNVPANAMALAYSKGIDINPLRKMLKDRAEALKTVIGYHDYGNADEGTEWDGPAQAQACGDDLAKLRDICAWYDSENADVKSSYKLPHHQASDKKAVWRGVAAAMGALLGGRGGVDIPEADRKGVYNHLAQHYKDFDKETPEFKAYEKSPECRKEDETKDQCVSRKIPEIMKDDPEMKQDQAIAIAENMCAVACSSKAVEIISRSNKETIESAIKTLTEVLHATRTDKKVDKVEHPEKSGGKKVSVTLLNKAIRELVRMRAINK